MALGWLMIVFIAVRVLLSAMTFSGKDRAADAALFL
jgi:hypothetical protein